MGKARIVKGNAATKKHAAENNCLITDVAPTFIRGSVYCMHSTSLKSF
jgi:hypothetical protein